jgi:hypothetical protein
MINYSFKGKKWIYFNGNIGVNISAASTTCLRKALLMIAEEIRGELNLEAWIGGRDFR